MTRNETRSYDLPIQERIRRVMARYRQGATEAAVCRGNPDQRARFATVDMSRDIFHAQEIARKVIQSMSGQKVVGEHETRRLARLLRDPQVSTLERLQEMMALVGRRIQNASQTNVPPPLRIIGRDN